jgi:hypothetical protein
MLKWKFYFCKWDPTLPIDKKTKLLVSGHRKEDCQVARM